jgi:hypothetical protein
MRQKKKHPDYARWQAMQQRCYRKNSRDYPRYGGRGIEVCEDWRQSNKEGFFNFATWLEQQPNYEKLQGGHVFARKDVDQHYTPGNCEIVPSRIATQRKGTTRLSLEIVVTTRKLLKEKPETSLDDLITEYGFGSRTIWSNALRGKTWQNADLLEAPIGDRLAFRETRTFKHRLESLPLPEGVHGESYPAEVECNAL